jgi:serine/threonine protein kinase
MSPEQAAGRGGLDGRSDLYSLGCVMYHLLSGHVPFPGESPVECMASRIKGRPVPLAKLRPGVPPDLVAIVNRLMATRRTDRYATAAEAAEALAGLAPCEPALLPGDRVSLVADQATVGFASISPEATLLADQWLTRSTIVEPAVPAGWWVPSTSHLSGWSRCLLFLAVSAALVACFIVGSLISRSAR